MSGIPRVALDCELSVFRVFAPDGTEFRDIHAKTSKAAVAFVRGLSDLPWGLEHTDRSEWRTQCTGHIVEPVAGGGVA